jgi:hypothetical protein
LATGITDTLWQTGFADALANPIVAFSLRAALGAYVIYMSRSFYADPLGYFRKWMPKMHETEPARIAIRGLAAFCLWGGCFILLAAVATQILALHGIALAVGLMLVAALAAWLLLPKDKGAISDPSEEDPLRRMK